MKLAHKGPNLPGGRRRQRVQVGAIASCTSLPAGVETVFRRRVRLRLIGRKLAISDDRVARRGNLTEDSSARRSAGSKRRSGRGGRDAIELGAVETSEATRLIRRVDTLNETLLLRRAMFLDRPGVAEVICGGSCQRGERRSIRLEGIERHRERMRRRDRGRQIEGRGARALARTLVVQNEGAGRLSIRGMSEPGA